MNRRGDTLVDYLRFVILCTSNERLFAVQSIVQRIPGVEMRTLLQAGMREVRDQALCANLLLERLRAIVLSRRGR